MRIQIINGPNLNNIGEREPNIYGKYRFSDFLDSLKEKYSDISFTYNNSHYESEIVDTIHKSANNFDGIILNAGAYTHSSVAIRDAIAAIDVPVVLVHISNVYAREPFRNRNLIAPVCEGIITGFGIRSYEIAIKSFLK